MPLDKISLAKYLKERTKSIKSKSTHGVFDIMPESTINDRHYISITLCEKDRSIGSFMISEKFCNEMLKVCEEDKIGMIDLVKQAIEDFLVNRHMDNSVTEISLKTYPKSRPRTGAGQKEGAAV